MAKTILLDDVTALELGDNPENYREVIEFLVECAEENGLQNIASALDEAMEETQE